MRTAGDDEIAADRVQRVRNLVRGAEKLEERARTLMNEAHELRKLAARTEEIMEAAQKELTS